MIKDSLGDRMKENYENRTRVSLMRRAYTIIRIDGKAFHTYTRGMDRPFDDGLMEDMDATAAYLCKNISGTKFAFVQSDEISLLLTDFEELDTQAWFDNNLQKMCSISSAMASSKFNQLRTLRKAVLYGNPYANDRDKNIHVNIDSIKTMKLAEFDARVFQVPNKSEAANYFIWRQQDTTRNSIQAVAYTMYSPKEVHKKNTDQLQEMIFQKGINWNDYASRYKRGRFIAKIPYTHEGTGTTRNRWEALPDIPIFTKDQEFLYNRIPDNL